MKITSKISSPMPGFEAEPAGWESAILAFRPRILLVEDCWMIKKWFNLLLLGSFLSLVVPKNENHSFLHFFALQFQLHIKNFLEFFLNFSGFFYFFLFWNWAAQQE